MRLTFAFTVLFGFLCNLSAVNSANGILTESQQGFVRDYESARERAEREQLPLLIHFQAFYCGPCRQMDSQVFSSQDVQQLLSRGLVAVQIDVTQHPELAGQYGADTVPRDVVVYPNGQTETLHIGFVPKTQYQSMLTRIREEGDRIRIQNQPKQSEPSTTPENQSTESAAPEAGTADPAGTEAGVDEQPLFLGLEGYCPVELHKHRRWTKGNREMVEVYRGIEYRFANEATRTEFRRDPGRFAPKNYGCDPVILLDSNRAVAGRIEYGAFFDSQLFLFETDENRTEFKKNPNKFTRIRHAIRVEEIEGTRIR